MQGHLTLFEVSNNRQVPMCTFLGTERLAAVLGADIVSTFDNPELTVLGSCDVIQEIMIGEDKVILH